MLPPPAPIDIVGNVAVAAAVAVAAMRTGGSAPTDAFRTLRPSAAPSVQPPTVATPSLPVVTVPPVTDPPPESTVNVTAVPDTGAPAAFFTITDGLTATAKPGSDCWPSPAATAMVAAPPLGGGGGGGVTPSVGVE